MVPRCKLKHHLIYSLAELERLPPALRAWAVVAMLAVVAVVIFRAGCIPIQELPH